jgi:FKBP-type peptidyl-prolyl cis-trans isomerase SlyD
MNIENNRVVAFHYQLQEVGGDYSEDSTGGDPMYYLHGYRGILPGLEEAMSGRQAGDSFSVVLEPAEAYGQRDEDGIKRVPVKHLVEPKRPRIGDIVVVNTRDRKVQATVVKLGRFNVDVDINHPLAGKTLQFDVQVVDVREATMDEVAHRHAHPPSKQE